MRMTENDKEIFTTLAENCERAIVFYNGNGEIENTCLIKGEFVVTTDDLHNSFMVDVTNARGNTITLTSDYLTKHPFIIVDEGKMRDFLIAF